LNSRAMRYLLLGCLHRKRPRSAGNGMLLNHFTRVARCTRNECRARGGPGATEESHNAKANVPNVYNLGSSTSALRSGQASRTLNPSTYYCLSEYLLNTGTYSLSHSPCIGVLLNCFIVLSFPLFFIADSESAYERGCYASLRGTKPLITRRVRN
jgi:hypothetical protein